MTRTRSNERGNGTCGTVVPGRCVGRRSFGDPGQDMHASAADQPAIVLHARAYRETSLLVNLLTRDHGRIAVVARGKRNAKRGHGLQPFYEGTVGWRGRGSLVALTSYDVVEGRWLTGNAVASAYYVTELVMRLTREWEPHLRLFSGVQWVLRRISEEQENAGMASSLRQFEKLLLDELGYGFDFTRDAESGAAIDRDARYRLEAELGFVRTDTGEGYRGQTLIAIDRADYTDPETRSAARRLFRDAIAAHLGSVPLQSRRLLRPDRANHSVL